MKPLESYNVFYSGFTFIGHGFLVVDHRVNSRPGTVGVLILVKDQIANISGLEGHKWSLSHVLLCFV